MSALPSSQQAVVFVNGTITRAADAVVPVFDHGFLYGEGIYETLRTYGGVPFLFAEHMVRLRHSAALMRLEVPYADADLEQHVARTTDEYRRLFGQPGEAGSQADELYIRMLLTRGVGGLTYAPSACPTPTLVIIVKAFPHPATTTFTQGIRVSLVSIRRNHPDALNPAIKSNNLLNNALAMQEALRNGADEALMQNQAGQVVECSQSNFFIVKDGEVITAPVEAGLLPGITRTFVINLAKGLTLTVTERPYTPAEVLAADEAFITGTTREVTPVVAVDEHVIGDGSPGTVTGRLLQAFRRETQGGDA